MPRKINECDIRSSIGSPGECRFRRPICGTSDPSPDNMFPRVCSDIGVFAMLNNLRAFSLGISDRVRLVDPTTQKDAIIQGGRFIEDNIGLVITPPAPQFPGTVVETPDYGQMLPLIDPNQAPTYSNLILPNTTDDHNLPQFPTYEPTYHPIGMGPEVRPKQQEIRYDAEGFPVIDLRTPSLLCIPHDEHGDQFFAAKVRSIAVKDPNVITATALVENTKFYGLEKTTVFGHRVIDYSRLIGVMDQSIGNPILDFRPCEPGQGVPRQIVMIENIERIFDPQFDVWTSLRILDLLRTQRANQLKNVTVIATFNPARYQGTPNHLKNTGLIASLFPTERVIQV